MSLTPVPNFGDESPIEKNKDTNFEFMRNESGYSMPKGFGNTEMKIDSNFSSPKTIIVHDFKEKIDMESKINELTKLNDRLLAENQSLSSKFKELERKFEEAARKSTEEKSLPTNQPDLNFSISTLSPV